MNTFIKIKNPMKSPGTPLPYTFVLFSLSKGAIK